MPTNPLVELETDKVTVEVPAPASGALGEILVKEGETVEVGTLLGMLEAGDGKASPQHRCQDRRNPSRSARRCCIGRIGLASSSR
jgi:pyruvate/2-oxoglutarate dehydrogenase complex dihydrolipoamide acyltransferase (E2) component